MNDDRGNLGKWLAIGCGFTIVGGVAFVVVLLATVFGMMRNSIPYQEAMQRARSSPRVEARLGKPIDAAFYVTGNIQTQDRGSGSADLSIPISGPKGKASVHVVSLKTGGVWNYSEMTVTIGKSGEVIDLLTSSERSPSTAPPAS